MTPAQFRKLALALPGAEERGHQGHPDFRVGGKIFATLGYPDDGWAMVKLPPDEQHVLLAAKPDVFEPASGAWGRGGSTLVRLARADVATMRAAMATAHGAILAKTSPKRR